MRAKPTLTILTGAMAAAIAGAAGAVNCYTVLDRSDNVIYRGTLPPIDMSERGQAEREAMRRRGEHLIAMDVDRCIGVEFFTGTAGSATLTVDQIVGGIPMRGLSPAGQVRGSAPASASAPAGPTRPAPAPASSVGGKGTRSSSY